jgi:hypothetical protein
MAANQEVKIDGKTILMVAVVVVLVGLALWQVLRSTGAAGGGSDGSFKTKVEAPAESARPPGFEKPTGESSDKT